MPSSGTVDKIINTCINQRGEAVAEEKRGIRQTVRLLALMCVLSLKVLFVGHTGTQGAMV